MWLKSKIDNRILLRQEGTKIALLYKEYLYTGIITSENNSNRVLNFEGKTIHEDDGNGGSFPVTDVSKVYIKINKLNFYRVVLPYDVFNFKFCICDEPMKEAIKKVEKTYKMKKLFFLIFGFLFLFSYTVFALEAKDGNNISLIFCGLSTLFLGICSHFSSYSTKYQEIKDNFKIEKTE